MGSEWLAREMISEGQVWLSASWLSMVPQHGTAARRNMFSQSLANTVKAWFKRTWRREKKLTIREEYRKDMCDAELKAWRSGTSGGRALGLQ